MYSNNRKISSRQTYRLFLFDFLGISTLVLPSLLAKEAGIYGIAGIGLAGILGVGYLCYLVCCGKWMQMDILSVLKNKEHSLIVRVLLGFLLFCCNIVSGGFSIAILVGMVKQSLIKEESFSFLLILTLLACLYAVSGGLESRARVYEILFWFVLIPLFAMLFLSLGDVEWVYLKPDRSINLASTVNATYTTFLCFGSMFAVMFFPGRLNVKKEKEWLTLKKSVCLAFLLSILILILVYVVLIGVFGAKALATMRYPVVTLMSTIQFRGGFVKRLDAFMLSIWFFTIVALVNQNLYYAGQIAEGFLKKKAKTISLFLAGLGIGAVGLWIGYDKDAWKKVAWFLWHVQMPIYLILPILLVLLVKGKAKKTIAMIGTLFLCLMTGGCASVELEEKDFPLLAVVQKENSGFIISYEPYEEHKYLDYNHLKVLIFEEDVLADRQLYLSVLQSLKKEETYPRNVYVCATKSGESILESGIGGEERKGDYLEALLLHQAREEKEELVTLGQFMDEMDNKLLTIDMPYLVTDSTSICQEGFYRIEKSIPLYRLWENGKN